MIGSSAQAWRLRWCWRWQRPAWRGRSAEGAGPPALQQVLLAIVAIRGDRSHRATGQRYRRRLVKRIEAGESFDVVIASPAALEGWPSLAR